MPELHLEELPPAFIYENILKPAYGWHQLGQTEEVFQIACASFLEDYYHREAQKTAGLCIRDLKEWVLLYVETHKPRAALGFFSEEKETLDTPYDENFIVTPSVVPIFEKLKSAILIRKNRFLKDTKNITGLNGFLLEGKPGMGKSEMFRNALFESGYTEALLQATTKDGQLAYLKVDASLPAAQKKHLIQQAFHLGQMVWLDEVNSQMEEGFEQWINAFLSGIDSKTHLKAEKPGFMLLVTANSMGMEGRSLIGPALRGRLNCQTMPVPNANDLLCIIKHSIPQFLILDK